MEHRVEISRIRDTGVQTLGRLVVYENGSKVFDCCTLEPSWLLNQAWVSCIPNGTYTLSKRNSAKYKDHFEIRNVNSRSNILIHIGNYFKNTEGCVLVGTRFSYIDDNDHLDVSSSGPVMDTLNDILPDHSTIVIRQDTNFQRAYG